MAIDAGAIKKLTDAYEALRKFAGTDDDKPAAKDGKAAVPAESPALAMAREAKGSYQKTARWMLGAFAAVGIVIFGSLPFAAIADVELIWPDSWLLIAGLLVAAAGIVLAVVAVSLVSEPEDASLGELERDLRNVRPDDQSRRAKLFAWWNPRRRARIHLAQILHGNEAAAHLGPNLTRPKAEGEEPPKPTVTDLIRKLRTLESSHAGTAPEVARLTATVDARERIVADRERLLAELRQQPESNDRQIRITAALPLYAAAVDELAAARVALVAQKAALAKVDDEMELYHQHRTLVLAESGIMQLRGTFRLARRILAVAAVLTLLGGTAYALALPGATEDDDQTTSPATPPKKPAADFASSLPAKVKVHAGTAPAAELARECVDRELDAVWVGDGRLPASVGPFTVVISDKACPGRITVGKGEGSFKLIR